MTLCELVFDLRFSSQIRTLAPALSLLLHEHEHAHSPSSLGSILLEPESGVLSRNYPDSNSTDAFYLGSWY